MWEIDPEDPGFAQNQRLNLLWSSVWKVSLALGLLILSAGVASLSVDYSTSHKTESFREGDLSFLDSRAVRFNWERELSNTGGIGLCCFGLGLMALGVVFWILPTRY